VYGGADRRSSDVASWRLNELGIEDKANVGVIDDENMCCRWDR